MSNRVSYPIMDLIKGSIDALGLRCVYVIILMYLIYISKRLYLCYAHYT